MDAAPLTATPRPIVLVVWHDAHAESTGAWTTIGDLDGGPYVVTSCGFLLPNVKPNHVSIVQTLGQDDSIDGVLHIPTAMVVSQRTVADR